MLDDFSYMEELDIDALVEIVQEMEGLEEVQKAMGLLERRAPDKALKLGANILEKNEGDHYLQGLVYLYLFDGNEDILNDILNQRKAPFGPALLNDVIHSLTRRRKHIELPKGLFEKIYETYTGFDADAKRFMDCDFEKFEQEYSRELAEYRSRHENEGER